MRSWELKGLRYFPFSRLAVAITLVLVSQHSIENRSNKVWALKQRLHQFRRKLTPIVRLHRDETDNF